MAHADKMIVSGIMHLDQQLTRLHRPITLSRSIRHLYIPHQLLLNHLNLTTSNQRPIPRNQPCQLCPGIEQRHNYLPIQLQRLHSSHQVCGETPSLAHTILQEISDAGIWKRTARSKWTILSRRSGQGRPGMSERFEDLTIIQPWWATRLYDNRDIGRRLAALFYELTKSGFTYIMR